LPRAGLPPDSEVLVVWVADLSKNALAVSESDLVSVASSRRDAALARMTNYEAHVVKETRRMTSKVVRRVRRQFPEWKVHSKVLRGKAADVLLQKVTDWNTNLIIGGSQGKTAVSRFFLGSVSKSVAESANCGVRVVRRGFEKTADEPIEIILGAKNPAEAKGIVKAVGRRVWPADTRIRLIAADDVSASGRFAAYRSSGKSIYETAADSLAAVGLRVAVQIESGDAEAIFLDAAQALRADTIFISAGSSIEQGLDPTGSSLITTSKCTVEIVR